MERRTTSLKIDIELWKKIKVELETLLSNFLLHKHSLDDVDEIICLIKDVELKKPVIVVKELTYAGPRKITISIDEDIWKDFQKFCEENDIIASKRIERLIQGHLGEIQNKKGGKK